MKKDALALGKACGSLKLDVCVDEKDENSPVLESLRDGLLLAAKQDAGAVEVGLLLAHCREGIPL